MSGEEWRPVVGFEGRYEVSSMGRVKTLGAAGRGRLNQDRILRLGSTTTGYLQVLLYPGGGKRYVAKRLHQVVLEAFVGPRPPGAFGLHRDDDRLNNRVDNLRWGDRPENSRDMVRNGNHNNARKTHCKWGHPFSGANLRMSAKGNRICLTCLDRRRREHRSRSIADH